MPRPTAAPGKKENYNLDYSRFSDFDHYEDEDVKPSLESQRLGKNGDGPTMEEVLRNVPPELREAQRILSNANESQDVAAQKRANELVLQAMEKERPEVQERFMREVQEQMRQRGQGGPAAGVQPPAADRVGELNTRIDDLKRKMEKDAENSRKQLEALARQQEELEGLSSPEDFLKFIQKQGMKEEDIQRMFGGDQGFMEDACKSMLDKAAAIPDAERLQDCSADSAEKALRDAEALHEAICGIERHGQAPVAGDTVRETAVAAAEAPAVAPARQAKPAPAEEPVKIPEHRLQYQKDADGRYTSVELRCELPGVPDMAHIALDVSEKFVRLTTAAPGPRFAVNAGPFPVLIDPSGARAKYSKRRSELTVTVPAKLAQP